VEWKMRRSNLSMRSSNRFFFKKRFASIERRKLQESNRKAKESSQ
jgi:hypothetical protein